MAIKSLKYDFIPLNLKDETIQYDILIISSIIFRQVFLIVKFDLRMII